MTQQRRSTEEQGYDTPILIAAFTVALMAAVLMAPLLLGVTPARADDTEVGGTGGAVYPIESTDIRLVAETVQAVVYGGFAEYRVEFLFENRGDARSVRLGFPFADLYDPESGGASAQGKLPTPVAGFRAWHDGRPLEVTPTLVDRGPYEFDHAGYFLHESVFPSGLSTVTVSYLSPPVISTGSRFADRDRELHPGLQGWQAAYVYWLHTGGGWAGDIGEAVVRYRLADTFLGWDADITEDDVGENFSYMTQPPGWHRPDEDTFDWRFQDFEPLESPYPVRVEPEGDATAAELAGALEEMSGVSGVVVGDSGTYVDARVDIENLIYYNDRLREIGARLQEELGPTNWLDHPEARNPYPYDVMLAFTQPYSAQPGVTWGPRVSRVELPDEVRDWYGAYSPSLRLSPDERATFVLEKTPRVREVRIVSGNLDVLDGFSTLARPKQVRLTFSDTVVDLDLEDYPAVQRFEVEASGNEPIEFEVLDTYPGTESTDVAVWKIEFGTEPAPEFTPFAELINTAAPETPEASVPIAAGESGKEPAKQAGQGEDASSGRAGWAVAGSALGLAAVLVLVGSVAMIRRRRT